jgi:hypothetical protein
MQSLKHLRGDGQDVTSVRQRSRIVVLDDACPLLGEGPEAFHVTMTKPIVLGRAVEILEIAGLGRHRSFRPQFPGADSFRAFRFLSEVHVQEFTKLQPTSP